jgi:hypothetical protein
VQQVTKKARALMAVLEDEGNDEAEEERGASALQLLRLRSANHEVVISPVGGYCLAVITETGGGGGDGFMGAKAGGE